MCKKTLNRLSLEMRAAYERFVSEPSLRNKIRETAATLKYIRAAWPESSALLTYGEIIGMRQAEVILKDNLKGSVYALRR